MVGGHGRVGVECGDLKMALVMQLEVSLIFQICSILHSEALSTSVALFVVCLACCAFRFVFLATV